MIQCSLIHAILIIWPHMTVSLEICDHKLHAVILSSSQALQLILFVQTMLLMHCSLLLATFMFFEDQVMLT